MNIKKDYHKEKAKQTNESIKRSPWLKNIGYRENFANVALKRNTQK